MDAEILSLLAVVAPSAYETLKPVMDRLMGKKEDEVIRIISVLSFASITETNKKIVEMLENMDRKLNNANEALAVLLKRTER